MRERALYVQDFAKHGEKEINETVQFGTFVAESFMIDAVLTYKAIYGERTPLMSLFSLRFSFEHPDFLLRDQEAFEHLAQVSGVGLESRKQFFDELRPLFR